MSKKDMVINTLLDAIQVLNTGEDIPRWITYTNCKGDKRTIFVGEYVADLKAIIRAAR
ncbi:MAG: hypothetical protein KOO69_05845 [Victivallales bacterium]|nr:hypothetical protein [Victivallales bacterium]